MGWIKLKNIIQKKDFYIFFGITVFYWIAGLRAAPMSDVPLYHLPVIHWMHESSLPIGLANLHDRFGFWNFWFSFCGGMSAGKILPFGFFTLNIVLVVLAFTDFFKFATSKDEFKNSWFCIALLILVSLIDFHSFAIGQKSPNADFAGEILCIWCASYLVMRKESGFLWMLPTLLLAGLAVLVKLNQAYLGLIIVYIIFALKNEKNEKTAILLTLSAVVLGGILMMLKSFWSSGCFVFPVRATCLPVSWRISDEGIASLVYWITRWGRNPLDGLAGNFNYWGWVPNWFHQHFMNVKIFFVTLTSFIVWLGLKIFYPKKTLSADIFVMALAGIGMSYWFLTAPDIRFGYGNFAIILCLILGALLERFGVRYKKSILLVISISLLISGIGQIRRADDFGADTLKIKEVTAKAMYNDQGQTVFVPDGNECWESQIPCTPYFDSSVIFSRFGIWSSFEKHH